MRDELSWGFAIERRTSGHKKNKKRKNNNNQLRDEKQKTHKKTYDEVDDWDKKQETAENDWKRLKKLKKFPQNKTLTQRFSGCYVPVFSLVIRKRKKRKKNSEKT